MPTPPLSIYYIWGLHGQGPEWSYTVFTSSKPEMIVQDPVFFFPCQLIIPFDDYLTDIEIDETIIIDAINELSSTSAAGPDAPHPLNF